MVSPIELAETYKKFQSLTESLRGTAIKIADFTETVTLDDGTTEQRRPVALTTTSSTKSGIRKRIKEWFLLRDRLHEMSPERFPLNSTLFKPEPTIIEDVASANVYLNTATPVRKYTGEHILKRLYRMRKAIANKPGHAAMYPHSLEEIERDIAYFTEHKEDEFRLRADNYTEVVVTVKFNSLAADGKQLDTRLKAHDRGIFLFARDNDEAAKFYGPDHASNAAKKRTSLYDSLDDIKTCVPYQGKLYLLSDVVKAETELAKQKTKEKFR